MSKIEILKLAKSTISLEAESLQKLEQQVDESFARVIEAIINSKGRVAITGIGKSAIIGQKISATFNSTGTPSFFMHAADAIHGDLGMIQKDDVVICISKSGNSPEIKALVPLIKRFENVLVGMVGDLDSYLAVESDFVLNTYVEKEACPNNLAPTTSTTAQMAMGDALAVVLLSCRDFKSEDFAKYHPGGSLGKKLYLQLADVAAKNDKPFLTLDATAIECVLAISKHRLGAVVILENNAIAGIITDGDIRRSIMDGSSLDGKTAKDLMTSNPKTIEASTLAIEGVSFLKSNKINHIILEQNGEYAGLVHIQDLITEGLT